MYYVGVRCISLPYALFILMKLRQKVEEVCDCEIYAQHGCKVSLRHQSHGILSFFSYAPHAKT